MDLLGVAYYVVDIIAEEHACSCLLGLVKETRLQLECNGVR